MDQPEVNNFIDLQGVYFAYTQAYGRKIEALNGIDFSVRKNQHIAVLGRNGSGKSTLAKLINGLELPDKGKVEFDGLSAAEEENIWDIRRRCGMIFQNPDNQIVGTTLEEDVAFGPENLGLPSEEIQARVDLALSQVGLLEDRTKAPSQLSGGQKQKLAIAGVLAMQPECMILDEATAMLDPVSSQDLLKLIEQLRQQDKPLTVVEITHDMDEAMRCDYIYLVDQGKVVAQGSPREIFTRPDQLLAAGLEIPAHLEVFNSLCRALDIAEPIQALTYAEVVDAIGHLFQSYDRQLAKKNIMAYIASGKHQMSWINKSPKSPIEGREHQPALLQVKDLSYTYQASTEFAQTALEDINLDVHQSEFIALVGHSGSGKSTLISHFNGLIRPQTGEVRVKGKSVADKKMIPQIRRELGLLFQYPEYQLFEETVYADIAFGPKQMGIEEPELSACIEQAAADVGLSPDLLERSPFELSGGQKRRAAIAGVLAMQPEILVLDEPAAGLDPAGRVEILSYIYRLKQQGKTVILVTHNMADAAALADRVLVLSHGRLLADGKPEEIFADRALLNEAGLDLPPAAQFSQRLNGQLGWDLQAYTPADLALDLMEQFLQSAGEVDNVQ